ncbi:MAG: Exodeoxyribonuclease 7 large subunit [Chroococcopsis gigantea SAG 12.99]|nr:Exodeoxyribonuclease 7 large subunit [Chroococcopsis gigantea SAG 12.99]
MDLSEGALSVVGLTQYIGSLLEEDRYLKKVVVTGEVSSISPTAKGLFFTLADPDDRASIKCVIWYSNRTKIAQLPGRGEQVIVTGALRLYPKRGEYQLTVSQCVPTGDGLQALRLEQLRNRLRSEGLFDGARKRPLPHHPTTIAVVSSPGAAAWGDIQRTLLQRYPGLKVLFSPAIVQGAEAPNSIGKAIARVARDGRAEVLILARGGGSSEDLACFNDERVVRAIAECPIPVVTGIGHQRDESLADLVADYCAHTPTAAAEIVVPSLDGLLNEHHQRVARLRRVLEYNMGGEIDRFQSLKERLVRFPHQSRQLLNCANGCELIRQKLIALDPTAVLKRGYAVVKEEATGDIIRDSHELKPGQVITVQLGKGEVLATVDKVYE